MTEKELPSDEELIQFYKSKINLLEARVEYARLDTELAELSARKYEALAKLAYIQNSQSKKEDDGNKSTSS
jgi:hypothetical protein